MSSVETSIMTAFNMKLFSVLPQTYYGEYDIIMTYFRIAHEIDNDDSQTILCEVTLDYTLDVEEDDELKDHLHTTGPSGFFCCNIKNTYHPLLWRKVYAHEAVVEIEMPEVSKMLERGSVSGDTIALPFDKIDDDIIGNIKFNDDSIGNIQTYLNSNKCVRVYRERWVPLQFACIVDGYVYEPANVFEISDDVFQALNSTPHNVKQFESTFFCAFEKRKAQLKEIERFNYFRRIELQSTTHELTKIFSSLSLLLPAFTKDFVIEFDYFLNLIRHELSESEEIESILSELASCIEYTPAPPTRYIVIPDRVLKEELFEDIDMLEESILLLSDIQKLAIVSQNSQVQALFNDSFIDKLSSTHKESMEKCSYMIRNILITWTNYAWMLRTRIKGWNEQLFNISAFHHDRQSLHFRIIEDLLTHATPSKSSRRI